MSKPKSVHAWGFFDDDGNPKFPTNIAASDLGVQSMAEQVLRNVRHFGGDAEHMWVTRPLGDELVVRVEFVVPFHRNADRMWHVITRPDSEWPDAPPPNPPTPTRNDRGARA